MTDKVRPFSISKVRLVTPDEDDQASETSQDNPSKEIPSNSEEKHTVKNFPG